jgi:glycosyltransferase involved in cell wall biosynthesis
MLRPFFRVIWTIHDPMPHSGRDSELSASVTMPRDIARRLATLIVVHGPRCRAELLRACPWAAGRVLLSQHGILMQPLDAIAPPEENVVLFFGRMERYKGLEVLTEAAELLAARGVEFRLVVAGIGPELDRLAPRLAGIPGTEVIADFVSAETASELFRRAAIVVLPYLDASQSGVAAAAFGNHRPVIASRVGGLPDVIDDGANGLLVEPGNSTALADALQTVLQRRETLDRMQQSARATAEGKLSWDRIASDMAHHLAAHMEAAQRTVEFSQR